MTKSRFPPGWDDERVRKVLTHYEVQTEEAPAEDEAVFGEPHQTIMEVPRELVPAVQDLIARQRTEP